MNWDAIGAIAEAVGAAGMIATLVYLAVQLRQNTGALRITSRQQVASIGSRGLAAAQGSDRGRVYSVGLRDYPNMAADETRVFSYQFCQNVNAIQEAFAFYEGGVLDRDTYLAHLSGLASHVVTPGGAALWREVRGFFPDDFVAQLDDRVAAGDVPDMLSFPFYRLDEPSAAQQSAAADSA